MKNHQKLVTVFSKIFVVENVENLSYGEANWDSLKHMVLIMDIEEAFEISLDPNDIVACSSFKIAKNILAENYGIEFDA